MFHVSKIWITAIRYGRNKLDVSRFKKFKISSQTILVSVLFKISQHEFPLFQTDHVVATTHNYFLTAANRDKPAPSLLGAQLP